MPNAYSVRIRLSQHLSSALSWPNSHSGPNKAVIQGCLILIFLTLLFKYFSEMSKLKINIKETKSLNNNQFELELLFNPVVRTIPVVANGNACLCGQKVTHICGQLHCLSVEPTLFIERTY